MSNSVIETIKTRSSIRAYKKTALTEEQIKTLTEAGLAAPSAMNRQDYKFIAISNEEKLAEWEQGVVAFFEDINETAMIDRLKERNNKVLYDAPTVIIIASGTMDSNYSGVDAGIAVQNIALAAKSMGLDSVILGMPSVVFKGKDSEKFKEVLSIPEGYSYTIAIGVGHADMEKDPHPLDTSKVVLVN